MMKRISRYSAITISLCLGACSDVEDRVPLTGKVSIAVPAAHDFFRPQRRVDSPPVIFLQTFEWYPNTCYYLEVSAWEGPDRIMINIGDAVSEGGSCGDAFIQAEAIIPIDTAVGRHELTLVHGDSVDEYEIDVQPDRVRLVQKSIHFTVQSDSVWWKIPRRSVAMTCQYSNIAGLCEEIIDSVFGQPWITTLPLPAFGVWPYPPNASVYIYRRESDFAATKMLLNSYGIAPEGQPAAAVVDLLNWREETYRARIAEQ